MARWSLTWRLEVTEVTASEARRQAYPHVRHYLETYKVRESIRPSRLTRGVSGALPPLIVTARIARVAGPAGRCSEQMATGYKAASGGSGALGPAAERASAASWLPSLARRTLPLRRAFLAPSCRRPRRGTLEKTVSPSSATERIALAPAVLTPAGALGMQLRM